MADKKTEPVWVFDADTGAPIDSPPLAYIGMDEPVVTYVRAHGYLKPLDVGEHALKPCECGCGRLSVDGNIEGAHPEDFRDERG